LNKIKWIIFAAITLSVFGLLIAFSNGSKVNVGPVDINTVQTTGEQNGNISDHVYGKADSPVTLIEYGDYQCPPCAQAYPIIKAVTEQYKNQIRFIFRNFPITSAHQNAKAAAATAEAAGLQGKYWEMHDKIYETQADWENLSIDERTGFFANYAKDLGLDITKFNTDVATKAITDKINYDSALGKKAGVDGTPMFYLNGTKIGSDVWSDNTKLTDAINTELTKAGIPLPQ
jgi:protein-disulfide isomerase